MILASTLHKLIARNASVYRVSVPAQTITFGDANITIAAYSRYFADKSGATKALASDKALTLANVEVSLVPATDVPAFNL